MRTRHCKSKINEVQPVTSSSSPVIVSGKEIILSPPVSIRPAKKREQKRKRKIEDEAHVKKMHKKSKVKSTHSSTAVFKCRPASLCQLIEILNDVQREAVESIGFGGLLHMHDLKYIPWGKMDWFFRNFNPTSRVLRFPNNKTIVFTVDDVQDLFLLPRNDGNNVLVSYKDDKHAIQCLDEFKEKYGVTTLTHSKAFEMLRGSAFADGGDDFKRLFVLYSLSIFLTPTLNQLIDMSTFRSLVDVDRISSFDWCKFVLEKLCNGLKSYPRRHISGCLLIIPLLYLHRFMWLGVAEPCTLPLIQHWTAKKLKDRLEAECSAGSLFGVGNWVDDGLYPISSKAKPKEIKAGDGVDAPDDVAANDARENLVHEEDRRLITYKLPANEKSDSEIRKIAKDGIHESFLLLQRDLRVITHAHLERLQKIRKNHEKKEETSGSHPDFHRHIDQVVEQLQNMKRSFIV